MAQAAGASWNSAPARSTGSGPGKPGPNELLGLPRPRQNPGAAIVDADIVDRLVDALVGTPAVEEEDVALVKRFFRDLLVERLARVAIDGIPSLVDEVYE